MATAAQEKQLMLNHVLQLRSQVVPRFLQGFVGKNNIHAFPMEGFCSLALEIPLQIHALPKDTMYMH